MRPTRRRRWRRRCCAATARPTTISSRTAKAGRVGGTTAVFDARTNALYFSKEVLPYIDPGKAARRRIPVFHHVGVYAYRPAALAAYTARGRGRAGDARRAGAAALSGKRHARCAASRWRRGAGCSGS